MINLLNRQYVDGVNWQLSSMVRHIHQLCISLEMVAFVRIPREWNNVADSLSKWALEFRDDWKEDELEQLLRDCAHKLQSLL